MARLYPDIHLNVVHGHEQHPSLEVLRREVADIMVLPSTLLDDQYMEHLQWADTYVLVTARNKRSTPHSFEALCDTVRYVAWRHPGIDRLHGQLAAAQIRLSHRGELSCAATLLDLVGKGHCMTIVPKRLVSASDGLYESVQLPIEVERRISVVARPGSLLSNAANKVIEVLKSSPMGGGR